MGTHTHAWGYWSSWVWVRVRVKIPMGYPCRSLAGQGQLQWVSILVMCWLRPEARSQARPGQKKPGQAGFCAWPEVAFGLACDF